ncbi:MAG: ABC transporter ATP-binding protein/permease [Oscillospiraceae bacterium]|jgi:ATP-binding cassette subfamily B protein|nr:ABC transporter ATP-binding protein/permease [Oscillospiraceae bacterium]
MARNTFRIDEELDAPFQWGQLGRAVRYMGKYAKNIATVFVITVASTLLGLLVPLLTQRAIDVYIPAKDIESLLALGGVMLLIIAFCAFCARWRYRLNNRTGQGIIRDIRSDLYAHLQKLPFEYYDSRPAGKIFVRVVNYVNAVADFLSSGLVNAILELLSMVFMVFYMLYISPPLTLVILSGLPLFVAYIFITKPRQRRAFRLFNNKSSNMTAYLSENINGVRVTQSFTREEYNLGIFASLQKDTRDNYMKAVRITHSIWPVSALTSWLVVAAMYIVAAAGIRSGDGHMTVGTVIAMAGFAWRFWWPVQNLGNIYNSLITAASYLERIFQVMDEPVTVSDVPNAYELPAINGIVTFLNVDFSYEPGVPVLKNVTFEVNQGDSIALVGPTGAGKSTVINLLSRFYNKDSGGIYIDGHDINEVTLASLRRQLGVMLQDTFIFSGDIMENIRYGRLDASDEECIEAAKAVRADEFIRRLPQGYLTAVHERGDGLSAGQRQLLSFARTLLSRPRVLILDEATSSIDTQTEKLVQDGIAALMKGRTSFIVAHRLSTIRSCTRILYISDGEIAESGSHDELIAKRGLYWHLYMSQLQA